MIHNQVKVKTILEAIFIITIMYAIVQFIQTVCYVSTQKGMIPVIVKDCVSILCFILFVAPVIIFILHTGFRNSRTFFLEFWRKHWIFYLFYIIVLFVLEKYNTRILFCSILYVRVIFWTEWKQYIRFFDGVSLYIIF